MSKAIFKKDSLKHYAVIDGPGTFIVKSVSRTYIEDGSKSRYLLNLRAATIDALEHIVGVLGQRNECSFKELEGCFITGTLWANKVQEDIDLPAKGEKVIASYDYNEDGDIWCTGITLIPRRSLKTFNPDAFNTSKQLFKKLTS